MFISKSNLTLEQNVKVKFDFDLENIKLTSIWAHIKCMRTFFIFVFEIEGEKKGVIENVGVGSFFIFYN